MYLHHEKNEMKTCGDWIAELGEEWFSESVDSGELSRMIYDPCCDQWFDLVC